MAQLDGGAPTYVNRWLLEALRMSDTNPEQDHEQIQSVTTSRPKPALSLRPVAAAAPPTDPATEPADIITTIVLKPGVRVTIEYPK